MLILDPPFDSMDPCPPGTLPGAADRCRRKLDYLGTFYHHPTFVFIAYPAEVHVVVSPSAYHVCAINTYIYIFSVYQFSGDIKSPFACS